MSHLPINSVAPAPENFAIHSPEVQPNAPQQPPGLPSPPGLVAATSSTNAGGTAVSVPSAAPPKRKRGGKSDLTEAEIASRRQAIEARIAQLESVLDAAESVPPTLTAPVPPNTAEPQGPVSAARDVWYFVSPVESNEVVPEAEISTQVEVDTAQQATIPFDSLRRPLSPYLRCRPCLQRGVTKVWLNRPGGMTRGLREHMEKYHTVTYYTKCRKEGFSHTDDDSMEGAQPEFSRAGLVKRLAEWIAVDDQALNVVEKPEFRDILLYCGQNVLKEIDVPHRTKVAGEALSMYHLEKEKIDAEMKRARGRISLTSDLWSDPNYRSHMAVTAHFVDDNGEIADRLIAFRKIDGQHTGENVGQVLFDILFESGIAEKIGCLTLDNASNNNTLMQELVRVFQARGIEFDEKENRIRCFPHIVNLAVHAIIKAIPEAAAMFRAIQLGDNEPMSEATEEYLQALETNPIEGCRKSVSACRSSGIRREGLRQTIVEGNSTGRFRLPGADAEPYEIPPLELLRDVPTRWSSTYNMVQRYLILYPGVVDYAFRNRSAQIPVLSHRQYEVLQDIVSILSVAHSAQELLSAEKTPTLSLAFPVYESIVQAWESLVAKIPELRHAIVAGINKIREYVDRTQEATVHTLAMVVNPSLKFEWINQHWSPYHRKRAYDAVKAKMLSFQCELYQHTLAERYSQKKAATQAQHRGYLRLLTLGRTLQRASSNTSNPDEGTPLTTEDLTTLSVTGQSALPAMTHGRLAPSPEAIRAHNNGAVEYELNRYIAAGTIPIEGMGAMELTEYWRVNKENYPLLYRIAMDVLPVQASSVSSERAFSSSKMTCTAERNRISTKTMESFQVLKHSIRRRRTELSESQALDFVTHEFENLELTD